MPASPEHNSDLLQSVIARATTDAAFRRHLLEDPSAAIFNGFGVRLPAAYHIRFIEKDAGLDTLIVLPDPPRGAGELDDDDLDAVAGGDGLDWQW